MLRRFKKRRPGSLSKRVRLSPKELYHRLALEKASFDANAIDLSAYYEASKDIFKARDRSLFWYGVTLGSLYLYRLEALSDFDVGIIKVQSWMLGYIILFLVASSSFSFAWNQAKIYRYNDLFSAVFNKTIGREKQDLLLRYPNVYSSFMYDTWMSGGPKFMFPAKRFPVRTLALLILMIPAILVGFAFTLWLTVSVSFDLWTQSSNTLGGWSKVIVVTSWALFFSAMLIPTLALRKIEFDHYGLTSLMEQFRRRDPRRYSYYVSRISATRQGQEAFALMDVADETAGGA